MNETTPLGWVFVGFFSLIPILFLWHCAKEAGEALEMIRKEEDE